MDEQIFIALILSLKAPIIFIKVFQSYRQRIKDFFTRFDIIKQMIFVCSKLLEEAFLSFDYLSHKNLFEKFPRVINFPAHLRILIFLILVYLFMIYSIDKVYHSFLLKFFYCIQQRFYYSISFFF